jgi:sugar/nucleoside kinase (ribokinase family)
MPPSSPPETRSPQLRRHREELNAAAEELARGSATIPRISAVIGFDAFVDESIRIVGVRTSPDEYMPMATITDFSNWASAAAGRSGLREFVSENVVAGGCSINMGDGLAALGLSVNAFVGVGEPAHPAFADFIRQCHAVESVGMEPGRAIVSEFNDGKLMLCGSSHFARLTPDHLRVHLDAGTFKAACRAARGVALTSWSVYPHMNDCWRHLCRETLHGLDNRPHFFFDLADPASRPAGDLREMADVLCGFESLGRVTLSLNGNEANQLARALGLTEADEDLPALESLAAALRERLRISETSIHLVKRACTATAEGARGLEGPFCPRPKKSVGAGDRFNAGFFTGLLLGLSPAARLALGCACSGFFVRQARSGSASEVLAFLRAWAGQSLDAADERKVEA